MSKTFQIYISALLIFFTFIVALNVYAQDTGLISSVKVKGNKRIDESTILYYLKTQKGAPISRSKISADIEKIYDLGHFKDIRVETQKNKDGVEVIFIVEEIPSIGDVFLLGNNSLAEDDIREMLPIKRGMTFQKHMIKETKEEIKLFYHQKGFFFAAINITSEKSSDNLINVKINIREGEKLEFKKSVLLAIRVFLLISLGIIWKPPHNHGFLFLMILGFIIKIP